jgi:hypothetical protein
MIGKTGRRDRALPQTPRGFVMRLPRRRNLATATGIALALALTASGGSGFASPGVDRSLQGRVDAYLNAHPGGKQINASQISYRDGTFIVTVPVNGAAASACPSGWFCFYDQPNFGGYRGQLSSCGWQDLAWYDWSDRTHSARYSLDRGNVMFINHAVGASHSNDVDLFWVGVSRRELANVSPEHRMADHVHRSC